MRYGCLKVSVLTLSQISARVFYAKKQIIPSEFCQVGQFKDYRFFLILISFVLADPRLFSDVTHCRLRPRIQKVCVINV